MMLEKITIKPPINKIVEILFVILSDNISPKLYKWTDCFFWLLNKFLLDAKVEEVLFQDLNIIPTETQANKWVIKRRIPILVFLNIKIPTVPIINKGPELFVKLSSLSHSSFEQILFFLKFDAILAPTG